LCSKPHRFVVRYDPAQPLRGYAEIKEMLNASSLPPRAAALAHEAFRRLAEAEASCHGVPVVRALVPQERFRTRARVIGIACTRARTQLRMHVHAHQEGTTAKAEGWKEAMAAKSEEREGGCV
jgi:hypothetical protein